jgi:hypothetical protein
MPRNQPVETILNASASLCPGTGVNTDISDTAYHAGIVFFSITFQSLDTAFLISFLVPAALVDDLLKDLLMDADTLSFTALMIAAAEVILIGMVSMNVSMFHRPNSYISFERICSF